MTIGVLLAGMAAADAEGLAQRVQPRAGVPYVAPSEFSGGLYGGLTVGFGTSESEDNFVGGGYVGYQALFNRTWAAGLELDLTNNPEGTAERGRGEYRRQESLDNWLASLRLKGGYMIDKGLQAYGTAGLAWQDGDTGLVYGVGVEKGLTERFAIRGEVLQYEVENRPLVFRIGATWALYP
jgi:opacity protein-like surface antigen